MEPENHIHFSEFILLRLSQEADLQPILFGLFLFMYLITLTGNLFIILATITDSHLHTPMYFFLSNLSFCDICFTSTTIPKMLLNTHMQNKTITYDGYLAQIHFFILYGELDIFLLSVMAYDRFMDICHPLHYTVIMNPWFCGVVLLTFWILSVLDSLFWVLLILWLSFCSNMEIYHFFCEINQIVQLACSDTLFNVIKTYLTTGLMGIIPFCRILYSYSWITSSILKITSTRGKYKVFSTCGSHLSVVFLFYGTGLGVYLSSAAIHNSKASATASVMYTVVIPMLNWFIYSLRNKDIKRALKHLFSTVPSNE